MYPLTFVERRCTKDYKVPGMDLVIPTGMLVQIARSENYLPLTSLGLSLAPGFKPTTFQLMSSFQGIPSLQGLASPRSENWMVAANWGP